MHDIAPIRLPGRQMIAAGLIVFGLAALIIGQADPGNLSQPIFPWTWTNGSVLVVLPLGIGLAQPKRPRLAAGAVLAGLALTLFTAASVLVEDLGFASIWVGGAEHLALAAAMMVLVFPDRRPVVIGARIVLGALLIGSGVITWMAVREIVSTPSLPLLALGLLMLLTATFNIVAGGALVSGRLARLASALSGGVLLLWLLLGAIRPLSHPTEGSHWYATAMVIALTGAVWTIHRALPRSEEDFQPSAR